MSDTNMIPFALSAADSFLQSAQGPYDQLSQRLKACLAGEKVALVTNPGELSPLISNVSFGIELLLKVIRIQDSSVSPRGHRLAELFASLDDEIKQSLEKRYAQNLMAAEQSGGAPYVLFNLTNITPDVDVSPAKSFLAALINMNKSFEEWRYLYELERLHSGFLYFNFLESIGVAKSLREEISQFKGGAVVKIQRA